MSTRPKTSDADPGAATGTGDAGPATKPTARTPVRRQGGGQRISRERGTATNHKKNPGKRAHKGGS